MLWAYPFSPKGQRCNKRYAAKALRKSYWFRRTKAFYNILCPYGRMEGKLHLFRVLQVGDCDLKTG